ncbi:S-adenosyl-L-methionine-dependent methyltransferase [Trametes polyzona]|nr:S-adenosyl-L-methionine-dependent methyltransferase [Trametes polyzona]
MKLSAAFALLTDLRFAVQAAFLPTLSAIFRSPSLLLHPTRISRTFMSYVWKVFGNGVDESGRPVKAALIPEAYGVVLDLGAGHGHTVFYLDPAKVTKYVALEPNELMHPEIRAVAAQKGFTEAAGTLQILPYGAEQTALITSALGGRHTADTVVSILTICSIPEPERAVRGLAEDVLKPGGVLLMYEHVLSPRPDVAWWQRFWTPLWKQAFDGCRLDRPTHLWIRDAGVWEESRLWGKEGEDEENLFWHQVGRFVKKAN